MTDQERVAAVEKAMKVLGKYVEIMRDGKFEIMDLSHMIQALAGTYPGDSVEWNSLQSAIAVIRSLKSAA